MRNVEPFGYFKAEPFGWTDCDEFDPDAQPLWDDAAMCAVEKQRDELLAALEGILNSPETRIGYDQYQTACDAIVGTKGDAA